MSQSTTEDESASKAIREEIRNIVLPRLQKEGKDPSNKDVYVDICKDLARKHKVDYNTAKRAYDRVLRERGMGAQPVKPQETSATRGGAQMKVSPQPKAPQAQPPPGPQPGAAPAPGPVMDKELNTKLFASMHKTTAEMIFGLAESAWDVKVKRPDQGMELDSPNNPYRTAGAVWAEVVEAYGIAIPKVLLLVGAGMTTVQVIALPLAQANAEVKKREKEKKAEEEQREQQNPPQVRQTPPGSQK